jgi:hypothetical protein
MRIRLLLAVLAASALTAVLSAQSFDLRLGQWEYTISGMKMAPEALAKMPPSARAAMEQMAQHPQTNHSCLTAQDLKELNLAKSDDEDCKVTAKKITGSVADITTTCTGDNPHTQTMHFEALSRESVRGTMKITGGNMASEMTITGKWVAAACKE